MGVIGAPAGLLEDWEADGSGKNKSVGVLLVHGYTGSPASMRPWAEYLNQKGFTVRVPQKSLSADCLWVAEQR